MKIPGLFFLLIAVLHGAPRVSDLVIADISDRSFRIVAHANEAVESTALIYSNSALTNVVSTAEIEPYRKLDTFRQNLASLAGLSIVDVMNLNANTTYYVRLQVRSLEDDSVTLTPARQVQTALEVAPFVRGATLTPLANPVLKFHAVNRVGDSAPGIGVLLAQVDGARTPVSTVVAGSTTSYLEMQNLIDDTTGRTFLLTEDLNLTVSLYRGDGEIQTNEFYTSAHSNLGSVILPKLSPGELELPLVIASGRAGQVFLEFPVEAGEAYDLEYSDTLEMASWFPMGRRKLADRDRLLWTDFPESGTESPPGVTPRRFYRLLKLEE